MYNNELEKNPVQKARENFVEKISVAGWKEAIDERVPWIRLCFRIALVLLSGFCLYTVSKGVLKWTRSGYKDEITDFASLHSLPMSNVSICAQIYLNQTFIEEITTIPESIMDDLRQESRTAEEFDEAIEEFYRQLTVFLTLMTRRREYSQKVLVYFKRVLEANPHLKDVVEVYTHGSVPCERMLRRCWFEGREFDCCAMAVRSYDDDGICYVLALNMDSDNAHPTSNTVHQRLAGPPGGLTIEASLPLRDFPWFEDDAQNGFRVIVGPVPFSSASPVLAPDLSETFVKVTPARRVLSKDCAPHGGLRMPGGEYMYYDPEGFSCEVRAFAEVGHKYAQCHVVAYMHTPSNKTEACEPLINLMLINALTRDRMPFVQNAPQKVIKMLDDDMRSALSEKSRCPTHCQYWTYSSTASFVYLDRGEEQSERTMYSKIHIYYGELAFRQHRQVKEITDYLAFCDFGNMVMLYWGMSIVSFAHIAFYVGCYVRALRKWDVRKVNVVEIS